MPPRKRKSSASRGSDKKARLKKRRRWLPILSALFIGGIAACGVWYLWIDYQIRRDFDALQWALPARL